MGTKARLVPRARAKKRPSVMTRRAKCMYFRSFPFSFEHLLGASAHAIACKTCLRTQPLPENGVADLEIINRKDKGKTKKKIEKTVDQGMGHIILAIAKKPVGDRSRANKVSITIYDSRPGSVEPTEIENMAKGVVRCSGWMGMSPDYQPRVWEVDPKFNKVLFQERYPNQGDDSLDCGVYTVLKAWVSSMALHPALVT